MAYRQILERERKERELRVIYFPSPQCGLASLLAVVMTLHG